jgi:predicted CXXCH cytochrome family protein
LEKNLILKEYFFRFQENSEMVKNLRHLFLLPLIPLFGIPGLNDKIFPSEPDRGHIVAGRSEEKKCTDCHSALTGHKNVHKPAGEGCDACHRVSAAGHPEKETRALFLADSLPALCFRCHDEVKKEVDTTRLVHRAVKEGKQCSNCHSPHSSDEKKLLVAGKSDLCLGCHDRETVRADGTRTLNMKQLLGSAKVKHSALNGGCSSCHKSHASTENYLLISSFPRERYVKARKENYNLCWECHDGDLFDAEKTTTATNFRNGDLNLHHLHLTGPRGRSCVICHDVHASNNKFVIVDKVAFGQWTFNMNFVPSDSGGSCYPGCHNQAAYKR